MGRLKNAMFDIGHEAMEIGLEATAEKYCMSVDDIKFCVLFVCAYDGDWQQFVDEGLWDQRDQKLH
tara:strand:+ start:516 stop:713 length:198 start_codon:yes stop_codon:yes gene_type:complete